MRRRLRGANWCWTLVGLGWVLPTLWAAGDTPVSITARDQEVAEVLRILAEAAEVPIDIQPEVQGRVTLRISKLPFEEALSLVLEGLDCQWRKIKGVYHVGRFPPETVEIPLQHREARELARQFGWVDEEVLKVGQGAPLKPLLPEGLLSLPEPTEGNALRVRGSQEALTAFRTLVQQLDVPAPEVYLKLQVFTVPEEIIAHLPLRWEEGKTLASGMPGERVRYAVQDFAELLGRLMLTQEVHLLFSPTLSTQDLRPVRLAVGWAQTQVTESGPPLRGFFSLAALNSPAAWPALVRPGEMVFIFLPRVEAGDAVRLWFRGTFGLAVPPEPSVSEEAPSPPAPETKEEPAPQPRPTLVQQVDFSGDGVLVPPQEGIALCLTRSEAPTAGTVPSPPVLIFLVPRVVAPKPIPQP